MTIREHYWEPPRNNCDTAKQPVSLRQWPGIALVLASISMLLIPGCGSSESSSAENAGTDKPSAASSTPRPDAAADQWAATDQIAQSKSAAAMKRAGERGTYLVVMITGGEPGRVSAMKDSLSATMGVLGGKADTLVLDASDPAEREFMQKYGVGSRGGLPMLLVFAPNGVVTGGYPGSFSTEQLTQAMNVSDLMLKVLKPLQEQKVALVALQNAATKFNTESWAGVSDFSNDANYKQFVTAVKADPAAAGSQDFVKQCQLIAPITEATVVILMPPGRIGKVLTGKLTKDDVLKALGSCATGCAPGGCSDRRFKENIKPIASALEKVTRLQGVTFAWNQKDYPQRFFSDEPQVGLLAQDVEVVIPEVVQTNTDGYKSITYDKLTAVLIEAVKEMNTKIAVQDSLIQAQNARIKALEAK